MLTSDVPSIDDEEGAAAPDGLPAVVDAHAHIFPRELFTAIHGWLDELSEYWKLIEEYDTLYLDTTMVLTDPFPDQKTVDLKRYRLDRIMCGSDFPNIPYAWDRELKRLRPSGLSTGDLEWLLNQSAGAFFDFGGFN